MVAVELKISQLTIDILSYCKNRQDNMIMDKILLLLLLL